LKSSEAVMKRLCSTASASGHSTVVAEQSEEDGSLQWRLALERLLPGVLRHSSPVVSFVRVKLCILLLYLCIIHTCYCIYAQLMISSTCIVLGSRSGAVMFSWVNSSGLLLATCTEARVHLIYHCMLYCTFGFSLVPCYRWRIIKYNILGRCMY
jgi:hypothetical protein